MKLSHELIDEICKKLKVGIYAKVAAEAEGITETTYYRWKAEGEQILRTITDKDGEKVKSKYNKLSETDKLKCEFCESVRQSTATGESALVAKIISKSDEDWRAALEILSRRFPRRWGRKDHLQLDAEIENKPNRLKELEEGYLADIPESKIKDVAKSFMEAVETAKNGKAPGKSKVTNKG